MGISKLRALIAVLLLGGLAGGVVWVYDVAGASRDTTQVRSASTAEAPAPSRATESRPGAPGPTVPTAPAAPEERQPTLEELRASDAYLEFAETRRARFAPGADRAYNAFGWDGADGNYYEFTNAATLWNEVVEPIRDDLLLAGDPYVGDPTALFGSDAQVIAGSYIGIYPRAANQRQVIGFYSLFIDSDKRPSLLVTPVAFEVSESGSQRAVGALVARMEPFTISGSDPASWAASARATDRKIEQWARAF